MTESAPGVVAVYDGHHEEPWCPVPLVGVAGKHAAALLDAARRGAEAAVLIVGDDRPGVRPRNVNGWIGDGEDLIIGLNDAFSQGGGKAMPGAFLRGGGYEQGEQAGVFALFARAAPSIEAIDIGARCGY